MFDSHNRETRSGRPIKSPLPLPAPPKEFKNKGKKEYLCHSASPLFSKFTFRESLLVYLQCISFLFVGFLKFEHLLAKLPPRIVRTKAKNTVPSSPPQSQAAAKKAKHNDSSQAASAPPPKAYVTSNPNNAPLIVSKSGR